jgi:hypothetical protein
VKDVVLNFGKEVRSRVVVEPVEAGIPSTRTISRQGAGSWAQAWASGSGRSHQG